MKSFIKDDIEEDESKKQIYNILERAKQGKNKVEIFYYSNQEKTKRIIHPIDMFYFQYGWGCATYCEL